MKKYLLFTAIAFLSAVAAWAESADRPEIEVTGSATLTIIPDRITVEIGMEEYYKKGVNGDSTLVSHSEIEKEVRYMLRSAGVPDSLTVVSDLGNYRNRDVSANFLMAKRISATVCDFNQIERISTSLNRRGITSFNITKIDNSEIELYNRQGLKAALDAARVKAEFIAGNEGLKLLVPHKITETTNEPAGYAAFTNVAFDGGNGMANMRRITRRYSVKVLYLSEAKPTVSARN